MAGQAPVLSLGICPEKRMLADSYLEALRELVGLHQSEMATIVGDGQKLPRSELALKRARLQLRAAKARYILHLQTHGC